MNASHTMTRTGPQIAPRGALPICEAWDPSVRIARSTWRAVGAQLHLAAATDRIGSRLTLLNVASVRTRFWQVHDVARVRIVEDSSILLGLFARPKHRRPSCESRGRDGSRAGFSVPCLGVREVRHPGSARGSSRPPETKDRRSLRAAIGGRHKPRSEGESSRLGGSSSFSATVDI